MPIYLLYQMTVILAMNMIFLDFTFLIETILGLTLLYLALIIIWRPYQMKIQNFAIIHDQATVVFFVLLQFLSKYKIIPPIIFSFLLFAVLGSITIALFVQAFRLYLNYKISKEKFTLETN